MAGEVLGVVRTWDPAEGLGVLDAPETPGGCWCHWSAVRSEPGDPSPGDVVRFTFEPVLQDGYRFRALEVRVDGASESPGPRKHDVERDGPTSAYVSELRIDLD